MQSLESYITENITKKYPEIAKGKSNEVPHILVYTLNRKTDEDDWKDEEDRKKKIKYLQKLIGPLGYLRCRGIVIEFAIGKISRYTNFPHRVIKTVEKIISYVINNANQKTILRQCQQENPTITMMTDASLGSEYDKKSRIGTHIWYGTNILYSYSKKTSITCDSASESELYGLSNGSKCALLFKRKIEAIVHKQVAINIICDCQPALDWLIQPYFKPRTKYLGLKLTRTKEDILEEKISVYKIDGKNNVADELTNPVPHR